MSITNFFLRISHVSFERAKLYIFFEISCFLVVKSPWYQLFMLFFSEYYTKVAKRCAHCAR